PGSVVMALGFFDGVHLGHQQLLGKAVTEAEKRGCSSAVLTFENHPLTEIFPRYTPFLLMDNQSKAARILDLGVDYVFMIPFSNKLRKYSPRKFLKDVLLDHFDIRALVAGFNYTFGYKGEGDSELLKKYGREYGFDVYIEKPCYKNDEPVSSTIIRELLGTGDVEEAAELLGKPYSITGPIQTGKKLGREYNIPTANIKLDPKQLLPKSGVYFTRFTVDGKAYDGLTNLGYNPTFEKHPFAVETYIYDFNQNIYGKNVKLEFLNRIRGEMKFPSLEALFGQIHQDILSADMLYRRTRKKPEPVSEKDGSEKSACSESASQENVQPQKTEVK
ncbi:MAG: bifunctional riboflavin kinase/FAD synthetase, partial [Eubacteriaceae bacterium]